MAMTVLPAFDSTRLDPYCDHGEGPDRPQAPHRRDPAKHSKKDPAKPTRAKAARPDTPALDRSLADLLNPGIGQGRAGIGAQTGRAAKRNDLPSPRGERKIERSEIG
jgi:excinuclease ABC subunit B